MIKLTESKNYRIYGVYETAILSFKNKQKADISIGDFQLINDNEILVITDQFDNTVPNYVLELTNYTLTKINEN